MHISGPARSTQGVSQGGEGGRLGTSLKPHPHWHDDVYDGDDEGDAGDDEE